MSSAPLATPGIDCEPVLRVKVRRIVGLRLERHFGSGKSSGRQLVSWHNVPRLGASVAFYTLLSLAPLLIIVIAVAGAVFGKEAAQGQLVWQIQDLIGRDGAETVQTLLKARINRRPARLATVFGLLTCFMGRERSFPNCGTR